MDGPSSNLPPLLFLLARLRISRTKASAQRLVDLATQMLDDVLTLWAKRDWLVDVQYMFDFIVSQTPLDCNKLDTS